MVSKSENRSWGVFRALMSLLLACAFLPIARPQAYAADDLAPASADLTAQEGEELEGTAYAVWNADSKTLTFVRSTETIADATENKTIDGVTGTVYKVDEEKNSGANTAASAVAATVERVVFKSTVKPIDLRGFFSGYSSLAEIEGISKLDTSSATTMWSMFESCASLTSLDLSSFDTSQCKQIASMFKNCSSLVSLDLSSFDTSQMTTARNGTVFEGCDQLAELKLGEKFAFTLQSSGSAAITTGTVNAPSGENGEGKYYTGKWIREGDDAALYLSGIVGVSQAGYSIAGTWRWQVADAEVKPVNALLYSDGELVIQRGIESDQAKLDEGAIVQQTISMNIEEKAGSLPFMNASWRSDVKKVTFADCSDVPGGKITPWSMDEWFGSSANGFTALEKVEGLDNLDTTWLVSLNNAFYRCTALKDISFGDSFDTSKVLNMHSMFQDDAALTELDLSGFDTSCVTDMCGMFSNCTGLESIAFGDKFDTSSVANMSNMFQFCTALTALDLSGFDTSNVTTMYGMFNVINSDSRKNLKSLSLGADFKFASDVTTTMVGSPSSDAPYTGKWALATGDGTAAYTSSELVAQYDGSTMAGEYVWQVDIKDAVIAAIPDQTYTGSAIEPELTVTVGEDEDAIELVAGEDYTVEYAANANAGTATATVVPTGRCTNSGDALAVTFKILPASLSGATVTTNPASYTYDGTAKTPAVTVKLDGKELSADDYTVSYSANTAVGTATATVTGKGNYTGTASGTFTIAAEPEPEPDPVATSAMYRLYNPNSGEHLFTTDKNEFDTLPGIGWKQEGTAWKAPVISSTPVYRLYNPYSGDHHYTMDANEYASLGKIGWQQEGICWYSDDDKGVGLYRLFNPNATVGTHHYTLDENEYNTLGRIGWKQEGTCWYGVK